MNRKVVTTIIVVAIIALILGLALYVLRLNNKKNESNKTDYTTEDIEINPINIIKDDEEPQEEQDEEQEEQNQQIEQPSEPQNQTNEDDSNTNSISYSREDLDIIAKDKTKVSIDIKGGTLTTHSATLIITDKNKPSYKWKPGYKIQVKKDGVWTDLERLQEITFPEITYTLNERGQTEDEINWLETYGDIITPGNYRIVKTVFYNETTMEFYVEFIVNES